MQALAAYKKSRREDPEGNPADKEALAQLDAALFTLSGGAPAALEDCLPAGAHFRKASGGMPGQGPADG